MSDLHVIASLDKSRREKLRVALDVYQGVELVDLRCTVDLSEASGIQTPTKKGVSFRREMLGDVIAALLDAYQAHHGKPYRIGAAS